jgi:integrase/recombinase XerD
LARTRLAADDGLELYRQKTGEPVYLPLEPELANELRGLAAVPEGDPRYFFWSGRGGPEHAANLWGKGTAAAVANGQTRSGSARPLWLSAAA